MNKNKSPWHMPSNDGSLKIATLNCAGLLPHFRDIVKDDKILQGHIVHLLETSLPIDCDTSDIVIESYNGHFINAGNGKGICTFIKEDLNDYFTSLYKENTLQIVVLELDEIDIISVYR